MKRRRKQRAGRDSGVNRGVSLRDPKKRPYQRYASRVLNKRALRSMALQALGRPAVAQGPLHDALLEIHGRQYEAQMAEAHRSSSVHSHPYAVVYDPNSGRRLQRFQVRRYEPDLEGRMNDVERIMHLLVPGWQSQRRDRFRHTFVVTYIARPW